VRTRALIAAACVAIGCAAGVVIALVATPTYRAAATMVVEVQGLPASPSTMVDAKSLVPTVAALATSDTVVQNVAAALRLPESRIRAHLRAKTLDGTALFRLSYDDRSRIEALRVDERAASVVTLLVVSRFSGGNLRLSTAVTDPPRTTKVGAPWLRDGLLGLLAGALVGGAVLAAAALRRREAAPEAVPEPEPEPEPELLPRVRAALAVKGAELDEAQLVRFETYLEELEAQAAIAPLSPQLERQAAGFFAPLLKP
jgi:capsular polysaccharide biosynthesis protein